MKRLTAFFILWLGSIMVAQASVLLLKDSVGTEVVNGKTYVLYRVEPKETLFGIANKYNLSVADLVKVNPETETGLKVGTIIKVPYTRPNQAATAANGRFHTVEPKETLYSISRQYNVGIEELKQWNNIAGNSISPGDRLRVNRPASATNATASAAGSSTTASVNRPGNTAPTPAQQQARIDFSGKIVHTVEEQETLYSIAKMYDTNVAQVREWNQLVTDNLGIGQKLVVGIAKGLPRKSTDRVVRNGVEEEKPKEYGYNTNPIAIAQVGDQSQEELETSTMEKGSVRKITEMGMAMTIDDSLNTKKYLALHRTAPIGTIMQVHNEMNNLSVFVRVVGKLPATAPNDKVLIKLSRKAYEKLGAYSEKVPVRLTYVP
ncbi:LysM peptidoglycan-binding domain-containing protein [Cesiribacter sp. SM1]|uniref:LysM peptidoglycan-binding domain-containing protein n=1 Tax=Cesiribacter sp. SM1 TaxID=2861196 RepID=UPI001CD3C844|nr:LysM peptidoglycan-binding domain-containing protein [Cesiribacter sp. SM1]